MSSSISMRSTAGPRSGAGPGGGSWTLTHTRPPATATDRGIPPTSIVFATRFVRGSIRETVPDRLFATHTAPAPTAMPEGRCPTGILASTARVEGSIRVTVPSRLLATQIASRLAAMAAGPSPSGIVSVTAPSPAATIRRSVLSLLSVTQTAPAPTAMPVGLLPTSKRSRTRLLAASILKTAASRALATHSEPWPNAAAFGVSEWMPVFSVGNGTASATVPLSASSRTACPLPLSAIQAEPPPTASPSTPISAGGMIASVRRVPVSICDTVPSATLATQTERAFAASASGRAPTGTSIDHPTGVGIDDGDRVRPHDDSVAARSVHRNRHGGDSRQRDAGGDQREAAATGGLSRGATGGRRVELGRLGEDRLLELAQLPSRLEPELVGERASGVAEALQCVGLAARPVQREHVLGAQALAHRLLAHEALELRHQLDVTTETEVGLDALLDRGEAQLLEPRAAVLGEPLIGEIAQRPTAPQRQRRAQELGGAGRIVAGERSATLIQEPLEAQRVDALGVDGEGVPAP